MRPVSIEDFIRIIHASDSHPPSPATVRRHCPQKDEDGKPLVPGAYKQGKFWKIDLDVYIPEMNRRIRGVDATQEQFQDDDEAAFIDQLAQQLAS